MFVGAFLCLRPGSRLVNASRTTYSRVRSRGTRQGQRFIPAHAGNSSASSLSFFAGVGSSPRMRGTLS